MIVEPDAGRKVFLIEDPEKIAIVAGSDGPVDTACGRQQKLVKVEVGYDRQASQEVDGIVRTIAF